MPDHPGLRPRHVVPSPLTDLVVVAAARPASGIGDILVTGVTHDSRQVRPGDLYLALPGANTHGARYIPSVTAAGAVAVLTDPAGAELATDTVVPILVANDPRATMGELAATVYGHPARDLLMLGVTGTNGKTTTVYLLDCGLRAAGHRTGVIGTVETRVDDERLASVRTTPEATDVHALLAVMRERGVTACAMEVSSHAMAFGRVDGIVFDVAGFTNLSQDHLDFHSTMEEYFAAKAALFTPERAERAVVVLDEYGRRLTAAPTIPTVTVGRDGDWRLDQPGAAVRHRGRGQGVGTFLAGPAGEKIELVVPIPGEFNIANAALAVAMLAEAGVDPAAAASGIGRCPGVPGRMELVEAFPAAETTTGLLPAGEGRLTAIVDFAHTPEAIDIVLRSLRPPGRLVVVVGAGGDRDRDKRPLMGAAAARWADVVVVTDDNPRSEDPATIRAAVIAGVDSVPSRRAERVLNVPGRREAIREAVGMAGPGDTVVVLGKGHEQGQEIAGVVHPFDDRDVLRSELRRIEANAEQEGRP